MARSPSRSVAPYRRRAHPEQDFQQVLVQWLDLVLPPEAWFTAIDHSRRGVREGARLKRMGVKKGLFDLVIFYPPKPSVLWLEAKSRRGVLTEEQLQFLDLVRWCGQHGWSVRTIEDAQKALELAGIPLRARIAA